MKLNTFEDDCQYNCWHDLRMAASSLKSSRLALGISREKMAMQYLLRHYLNATVIRHDNYCLRNWNTMSLCFFMIDFNIDILPSIDIRCSKCHPLQFHYNLGPTRDQQTRYVPWPYLGNVRIFDFIIFRLVNIRRLGIRVQVLLDRYDPRNYLLQAKSTIDSFANYIGIRNQEIFIYNTTKQEKNITM